VWIKNCFAVGLSANFVEPLEATSIGTSIQQSYLLSHYLINYDDKIINHVNNLVEKIMLNIRDFICLHYITKRKEEFWKTQVIPDTLKYKLDLFKNRLPIQEDFNNGCKYQLFWDKNYIHIMQGLNLINKQKIKKQYELLNDDVKNYISDFNIQANNIITHKQYLTNIRNEL
jgi:tryptophan halogenase